MGVNNSSNSIQFAIAHRHHATHKPQRYKRRRHRRLKLAWTRPTRSVSDWTSRHWQTRTYSSWSTSSRELRLLWRVSKRATRSPRSTADRPSRCLMTSSAARSSSPSSSRCEIIWFIWWWCASRLKPPAPEPIRPLRRRTLPLRCLALLSWARVNITPQLQPQLTRRVRVSMRDISRVRRLLRARQTSAAWLILLLLRMALVVISSVWLKSINMVYISDLVDCVLVESTNLLPRVFISFSPNLFLKSTNLWE